MTRYFSKQKAIAYDDGVYLDGHTARGQDVLVEELTCRNTGLLDDKGDPLYATNRVPCGFMR